MREPMKLHKKRYNIKFISFSLILLTIILSIWSFIFYTASKKELEKTFQLYAESVALSFSSVIEESSEDYIYLLETYDTNTDFYKKTYNAFADTVNNSNISYIYTVEWFNDEEILFIIDCVPETHKDSTPIGTKYEMGPYAKKAFETNSIVSSEFEFYESWNSNYLSAFSPIINPTTKETLGLVGVDINIDKLKITLDYLLYSGMIVLFLILIIIYILLMKFSDILIKPYVMDALTNIYNRKFFLNYLEYAFNKSIKKERPLSLLSIDIDYFKKINDIYGHNFGDIILKELCNDILKNIGKTNCFARYGGEEFLIILENVDEKTALEIGEKLRISAENLDTYNDNFNMIVKVTISIGVSSLSSLYKNSYYELIEQSDKALYLAKTTRNSIKSYSDLNK